VSDPTDLIMTGLGSGGGALLLQQILARMLKRGADAEEKAAESMAVKLDKVLEEVGAVKHELGLMAQSLSTTTGTVAEVKARIDGVSANHGGRLGELERKHENLETRLAALERRRGK